MQHEHFAALQRLSIPEYLARMAAHISLGRAGLPEDTAAAVAFLCSDQAASMTAESMNLSGGAQQH